MINKETLELIKSFEGLELKAYKDAVGVWTIGYGHTSMAGDPKVVPGMVITKQEAEALLLKDLVKYENGVKRWVKVPLNPNQYGALVSFCYNVGEGNLSKSTLVKKVNAGDFAGAAKEFAKWNKAGGKELKGLTRRRTAEASLFLRGSGKPVEAPKPVPSVPVQETPKAPVQAPKAGLWAFLIGLLAKIFKRK